jgi:hypothetical protein
MVIMAMVIMIMVTMITIMEDITNPILAYTINPIMDTEIIMVAMATIGMVVGVAVVGVVGVVVVVGTVITNNRKYINYITFNYFRAYCE